MCSTTVRETESKVLTKGGFVMLWSDEVASAFVMWTILVLARCGPFSRSATNIRKPFETTCGISYETKTHAMEFWSLHVLNSMLPKIKSATMFSNWISIQDKNKCSYSAGKNVSSMIYNVTIVILQLQKLYTTWSNGPKHKPKHPNILKIHVTTDQQKVIIMIQDLTRQRTCPLNRIKRLLQSIWWKSVRQ